MSLCVIIPAFNEEESIEQVLVSIPGNYVDDIIVVDGGSTDRTVDIAEQNNARVISEHRRGYGQACTTGVQNTEAEIVIFLDADGANNPQQVIMLTDPINQENADMVLGSRLAGRIYAGAMPWHQLIGNWLSAKLISVLYGEHITDLSPFRAVRRSKLQSLHLQDMTYGYPTEMITKAMRRGWRILEVPVDCYPRTGGKSKISGTMRGTFLATLHIISTIFRYINY